MALRLCSAIALLVSLALGCSQEASSPTEPRATWTATELIGQERDVFAELVNFDAALIGREWNPAWTCPGMREALEIETAVGAFMQQGTS